MAKPQGNGRNVPMSDEDRMTWRPQDENGGPPRSRRNLGEGERTYPRDREFRFRDSNDDRDEDRYVSRDRERMGSQWDDRSGRWDDREDRYRPIESYVQRPSGYGRYEGDRLYGARGQSWRGENDREWGFDERFGRGPGEAWSPTDGNWSYEDRARRAQRYGSSGSHYGQRNDGESGGGYLGQGGQQMGYRDESGYGAGGRYDREALDEQECGPSPNDSHAYSQGFASQPGGGRIRSHRGKGPAGYVRSDERIREIVCEVLTEHHEIDATNIEVSVQSGEVTIAGIVDDRRQKRLAEDAIAGLSFVKDVINQVRVGATRSEPVGRETMSSSSDLPSSSGNGSDKRHRA